MGKDCLQCNGLQLSCKPKVGRVLGVSCNKTMGNLQKIKISSLWDVMGKAVYGMLWEKLFMGCYGKIEASSLWDGDGNHMMGGIL